MTRPGRVFAVTLIGTFALVALAGLSGIVTIADRLTDDTPAEPVADQLRAADTLLHGWGLTLPRDRLHAALQALRRKQFDGGDRDPSS